MTNGGLSGVAAGSEVKMAARCSPLSIGMVKVFFTLVLCHTERMSDDQFTKLFKYMEQRFDASEKRLDSMQHSIDDIRGAIGELSAQVRDYHNEMTFASHQMNKLRDAILQIARETGVKLSIEL